MSAAMYDSWLPALRRLCRDAGAQILAAYRHQAATGVRHKADGSPVTRADHLAHVTLLDGLQALTPDIPVQSEEGACLDRVPERVWVVDPLDGTREFLAHNGEFSVNVALLVDGIAELGLLYVPVCGTLYTGRRNGGAWCEVNGGRQLLDATNAPRSTVLRLLVSRSRGEQSLATCRDALTQHARQYTATPVGSALKFAMLAAGQADLYPCLAPTHAWDVAAGQVILEAAGGAVFTTAGKPLRYEATDGWLNPSFFAVADRRQDWRFLL